MFHVVVAFAVGYLLGSFPSARVIAKLNHKNIFELGSGNMGAMNTARHVGWVAGIVVFILDVSKGALASYAGLSMAAFLNASPFMALTLALSAGVGAVTGHAWPVTTQFKGGKALAAAFGVALPIYPIAALYALGIIIALHLMLRRSFIASLITVLAYPLITYLALLKSIKTQDERFAIFTAVLIIAGILTITHLRSLRTKPATP